MFEKVGIPILGVVENMSLHVCSNCGHTESIFGHGGAEKLCHQYDVDFLGGLPLDIRIREQTDVGKPTVVADPDGTLAQTYRSIARRLAARVAAQPAEVAGFPTIKVSPDLERQERSMKICIVGAGAIGGILAARLLATGHDVSVIARGHIWLQSDSMASFWSIT